MSLSVIYLDITKRLPPGFSLFFTSFQLFPSILKIFFVYSVSSIGIIAVVVVTALFGRVYCSTLCPLGTYQDLVLRLSRKYRKRRLLRFSQQMYALHYGLLSAIVAGVFFGSVVMLNLLEPFSNFGRMMHSIITPIVVAANNLLASMLISFNIYWIYEIPSTPLMLPVLGTVLIFFTVLTYLAYNHGRIFCNSLCPAGALLGLIARVSIFKLVINETSCTHCKLCEKVCKAQCIDSNGQILDFSACVGCFNCIDVCHTDGVVFKPRWKGVHAAEPVPATDSRRLFLRSTAVPALAAFIPMTDSLSLGNGSYAEAKRHPVAPPGSISIEHFSSTCTACQLCVSSCPTHVLQPAFFEYGLSGILQPRMDYSFSFCNYDCTVCTEICPAGALVPLRREEKKLTQLGKAKFYKEDCIVITKKKDCGACSEHCPTKAVAMVLHDGVFLPEVNEKICIGCGACEHACPTTPRKAIFIEANRIHAKAEKPTIQKPSVKEQPLEEFPF